MAKDFIEGRNAFMEALRAGKTIDRLYIQENLREGAIQTVIKKARDAGLRPEFVSKERMDQMSRTGKHQGVLALSAAYSYASLEEILERAKRKGEEPFLIFLDGIEDPHNLGAIIRTANACGAHGVVIPKNRAVGLTPTVIRTSAGALNFTPVAKVSSLVQTIRSLKQEGLWFVCGDMEGESIYRCNLKGPIGLVIGNEGKGVGRLIKEQCDFSAFIPLMGEIDSLNASVAAGVFAYEILRQRSLKP